RHLDLLDAASDAAAVARLDQPLCRSNDTVCCGHRRAVPDHTPWAVALFLLADAVSKHDDGVAAVAQRTDMGFLGNPKLFAVLDPVLVRRSHPGFRYRARPRAPRSSTSDLWGARLGMARVGAALARVPDLTCHFGLPRCTSGGIPP